MIRDLMSRVAPEVPAKITAVYMRPTIPRIVNKPPKKRFRFMTFSFNVTQMYNLFVLSML